MILDMFLVLLGISLFFVWLGFYIQKDGHIFSIVGFSILFILGSWVMLYQYMPEDYSTSGLQYQTGSIVSVNGSITTISNVYSTYNDSTTFWVGLLLSLTSAFSIWLVLVINR